MKISVEDLTTDRQWRSATGYSREKFLKLLDVFEPIYEQTMGDSIEAIKAKSPGSSVIKSCEELLLFTLFSLKSGLTYDNLGFVTGMDGSNAKRNQEFGVHLLKEALQMAGVAPKREFSSLEEFQRVFAETDTILIDGTEQRIERLQDPVDQRATYSGKKKLTPLKRPSLRRQTK